MQPTQSCQEGVSDKRAHQKAQGHTQPGLDQIPPHALRYPLNAKRAMRMCPIARFVLIGNLAN